MHVKSPKMGYTFENESTLIDSVSITLLHWLADFPQTWIFREFYLNVINSRREENC
jgi:hypothetical protein